MSYLGELLSLIERLRERVRSNREYLEKNEAATRACLVDPVLHLLGWDISAPDQVRVEFKVEGSAVDYALMHAGKPAVLIEAKSLGTRLRDDIWQLAVYAAKTGAYLAVITNGDEWVFLDPNSPTSPQKGKASLLNDDPHTCALTFLNHLDAARRKPRIEPPVKRLSLRELAKHIESLAGRKEGPKIKSVQVSASDEPIPISSYASLLEKVAEAYASRLSEKLPISARDKSGRYIAAKEARHGTSAPFITSHAVKCDGEQFFLEVHGSAITLTQWAIRLLTAIGVDPNEVIVELA